MDKTSAIDKYINIFPNQTQTKLRSLRATIKKAAPDATEIISYGIPTFKIDKNLVHFAAYKNHIGFYPTPSGIIEFKGELSSYKTSKGAIIFPLNRELPIKLIQSIVEFGVSELKHKRSYKVPNA
jgi:uncharacterized protein YdhG (YjbR/CyaY superfamily)